MRILVMPGDGIGPEIVTAAVSVLQAADGRFELGLAPDYDVAGVDSLAQ